MHELSVCQGMLSQVSAIAQQHGASGVSLVKVQIGPLSGVEPQLLAQAFPIATAGTIADGAVLEVATLPVIALGVGVGVDYGIYIFNRLRMELQNGHDLHTAYYRTLRLTGRAVIFTGFTLATGLGTWIFSALQFQADMGILLCFIFLANMIGAIVVLPALVRVLMIRNKDQHKAKHVSAEA
mgnify:CR=1 FL=1